jgi:hypothetical protein
MGKARKDLDYGRGSRRFLLELIRRELCEYDTDVLEDYISDIRRILRGINQPPTGRRIKRCGMSM